MKQVRYLLFISFSLILFSCNEGNRIKASDVAETSKRMITVPEFNADSAYQFVEKQVSFGPRVPGSAAHKACATYLAKTLERFCDEVIVQDFSARAYNGSILDGKNIIGIFKPDQKARIMLCAHWDSRPYADHDPDPANHNTPIPGANDGASGVGVLLEVARQLSMTQPEIGVDIIFFDLEDYGPPSSDQGHSGEDHWGLGSQYWSKNPHKFTYKARYAILLDMVGVPDPQFRKEGFSVYYASDKVDKVWGIANSLGYGSWFLDEKGGYITDDHYYVNKYKKIPALNIIHLDNSSPNGSFFEHWHTLNDNMDYIDRESLDMVGTVVLEVVFRE
ncbi:MAG: M28 family peptidase [Bacteroidetes bacterium]|nr:M28 family peptidase [Bacteroidota bacterium]